MGFLRRLVEAGQAYDVCCVVTDSGRSKVEDFLKSYRKSNPNALKRAVALFQNIAENGMQDLGPQKMELLRDNVIELKVQSDGLRFFGFVDADRRNVVVLERGWKKGPRKEQDSQIDEVVKFKKDYRAKDWPIEK